MKANFWKIKDWITYLNGEDMNKKYKLKLLFLLCCNLIFNQSLYAHGYQTAPYSRIANTVDSGQKAELNYNPNQISNNLPNNLGSKTLNEILNYNSGINGTGPLAFYKDYYTVHNDQLCAYAANNQGYLPILNKSIPDNKMTAVSAGDFVQFKWGYTAWHTPSNNFVFITKYPAGQYKPNPSLDDLQFVCAVTADSSGAWQCKLPVFNGDAKQVMVTIWQRVDSAGENFISCADVKVVNGTTPENIWSLLGNTPWTSGLIDQPKVGDLVTFTLESEQKVSLQKSLVASYSLSITTANLSKWASILASKINNDSTHPKVIAIGQLNNTQGNIIYDENNANNNYIYLNNTISDPLLNYSYSLSAAIDPNPVTVGWQQIGDPLKVWVNSNEVKINDQLRFSLQVAGVEQNLAAQTVSDVASAEKMMADQINQSVFNGLRIAAGVLQGSGDQSTIQFIENGDNRVYVYRSSDDTTNISYVIRNLSAMPTYPLYPAGIGSYKVGSLVQNGNGQAYVCLEAGWCNLAAYDLSSPAWRAVTPKPAPAGYLTYPEGKPYKNGNIVADIEGALYKCTQAAWCNDQSGVYAPGIGRAWSSAWEKQ
jgi:predicted carbohydrate-binding protein with CBM5 and CBM33 domain